MTCEVLVNHLPTLSQARNPYNIRHPNFFTPFRCRTELFYGSFFPATIRAWNMLPVPVRDSVTLLEFKSKLKAMSPIRQPPEWYYVGPRFANIMLCRLRNGCSSLNRHLFDNFLSESASCSCGHNDESTNHYLLHCALFNEQRVVFQNQLALNDISLANLTVNQLLYGTYTTNLEMNKLICNTVCQYIINTNRFQ